MALEFPPIDPVAFSVGPFLTGFLLGWRYVLYLARLDGDKAALNKTAIDDLLPWVIVGVILGGRAGYVLFYQFDMYIHDPLEMLKVWHGGMSFHGGALGAIAAMVLFGLKHKLPVFKITDYVCCAVPIGLFFGRIANFVNAELYGRASDAPWAVIFPGGGDFGRHPSQLYEAFLEGAVLFAVLAVLAHRPEIRNRPGIISGVFLCGYALARMVVELFREPDSHLGFIVGSITMGQILSVPMILGGAFLVFYASHKKPA